MNKQNNQSVKKKLLTSALCLILMVFMLLSSTLAWFTDTASTVNTMTVGKISIAQTEEFDNVKVIMPTEEIRKRVTVTNDGDQDCYVRTLFAFEDSADGEVLKLMNRNTHPNVTITMTNYQFTATKDGVTTTYTVGYYVYPKALAKGESYVSLESIMLDKAATMDWQEKVGDKYDIIVLSQATQTNGLGDDAESALNEAFEVITAAKCQEWFTAVLNGHK